MNKIDVIESKNNIIKKHNELVQNARYNLSELGIKVVSCLISMIKVDDKEFQQYLVSINDFKELINSTSKNTYEYSHSLIKELMSNPIKINDEQFNWVSYGKYEKGSNHITFEIHRNLKPYLLELKQNFIQYNIQDILSLKSSYVIRFYELLVSEWKQYRNYNQNAKNYTFEIEIDYIRKLFEIPESYKNNDIKRHIFDKAQEQFKAKTSIKFEYKEQKLGRKVVRIQVTVSDNLISFREFLKLLRINGVNKDLLSANDKDTGQQMILSVSEKGRLYDKMRFNYEFTNERAEEIYKKLYDMYLDGKLKLN